MTKNSKANTKSTVFNLSFIIIVFVALIIYIINVEGIDNIVYILQTADYMWIILGMLCVLLEWLLEAFVMHIPLKNMYPNHKFGLSLRVNIIGRMFNNITPFSSGGQPFQAYILSKNGLRASDTFSVLMMKFVIYQADLFTWAILLMIMNYSFFQTTFEKYMWLVMLGVIMNAIAMGFILLAGFNKKMILRLSHWLIRLGAKIKIGKKCLIKNIDMTTKRAEDSITNYNNQFNQMQKNKPVLVKMYAIGLLQLLAYFSIPFMIYKAFANVGVSYIQIITVEAFLLLVMSFIPTPGSGGGAEGGFALFFKEIFTNGLNMAILFWRIYTFYIPIIVGAIVFGFTNKKNVILALDSERKESFKDD